MRSSSAFDRSRAWFAVALTAGCVSLTAPARAEDEKKACSAAYDESQSLRADGKLAEARAPVVRCARSSCPKFIRVDCAKWLVELDAALPTIVFDAGTVAVPVEVAVDGKPWPDALDGKSKPIDPGTHTFRYATAGAAPHEETIVIVEGQKDRIVKVTLAASEAAPTAVAATNTPRSIAPFVVGGIGVAGLLVGAITGAIVLAEKSTATAGCSDVTRTCTQDGKSAADTGRALGPVSTVGFVAGGVGVGVAAVWLVMRRPGSSTSVQAGPAASANGAGWHVAGTW